MRTEEFATSIKCLYDRLMLLSATKGEEYKRREDNQFANFERGAAALGLTREQVLLVYLSKHIDSITTHVKDAATVGVPALEYSEPLAGRIDDAILYLLLLRGMMCAPETPAHHWLLEDKRPQELPSGLSDDEIFEAVCEITKRIEACGASIALTRASSLSCDLARAIAGHSSAETVEYLRRQMRRLIDETHPINSEHHAIAPDKSPGRYAVIAIMPNKAKEWWKENLPDDDSVVEYLTAPDQLHGMGTKHKVVYIKTTKNDAFEDVLRNEVQVKSRAQGFHLTCWVANP